MANVQTRRSISFALADFEAAQELAISMGIPLAQLAAQALREFVARNRPLPPPPNLQPELDKRVGVLPRCHDPQMWPEISRVPVEAMNDGPNTLPGEQADHPDAGEVRVVYDEET